MDNVLKLENRHTGEILHLRRVPGSDGQTILEIDGPPARRCTSTSRNSKKEW